MRFYLGIKIKFIIILTIVYVFVLTSSKKFLHLWMMLASAVLQFCRAVIGVDGLFCMLLI
ncbi:hypothetical protein BI347_21280 [Chromobacterium sphagni]|uniref:Uncharacterized protein n=1 Tax=Chromobacterium sphagni TaxID=1903179 RepID=A0A1S1WTL1_9NEIS|nr:hypothetical protein BI347_21280 [Chromobacterium sphagni]OHX19736.1 hypothetical protein BI344_08895 [Chromobacterium sphagni]